jgi:hypothetical protein
MKNFLYFGRLRLKLFSLLTVVFFAAILLNGCEQANFDFKDHAGLNAEQLAADQQQIAQALGRCLKQRVAWVDVTKDSVNDVAARLHQSCLYPFMALRQSKLNYADVPDIANPPPKVLEDELAMCALIVERRRLVLNGPNQPGHPNWTHPPLNAMPEFNHPPIPKSNDAHLPERWVL